MVDGRAVEKRVGETDHTLTTSELRDSGAGARVSTFAVLRRQRHVRRNLMRIPKPVVAAVALALVAALAVAVVAVGTAARGEQARTLSPGLWRVYDRSLSKARYIDLTHSITPNMPVWKGFGPAKF